MMNETLLQGHGQTIGMYNHIKTMYSINPVPKTPQATKYDFFDALLTHCHDTCIMLCQMIGLL